MPDGGFARDRVTLLAYAALGAWAYVLYAMGLVLPFLRTGLHLSYTTTSLHSTMFAAGSVAAGVAYAPLAARYGRRPVFWGAAGVLCAALVVLVEAGHVGITVPAAGVLGLAGSCLLVGTSVVLADRHGELRDRAFVEANVVASASAVLAPLLVGAAAAVGLHWQVGLLPPVLVLLVLYVRDRSLPLPSPQAASGGAGRLSSLARLFTVLVGLTVGVEFCIVLWGVDLLRARHGLTGSTAALLMTGFYVGELGGRAVGSTLARPGRAPRLIAAALVVTAVGFLAFWLALRLPLAVAGLVVAGVGVANLYPLALSLAVAAAEGRTEVAAARAQLSVGTAVLAAPFALGALADRVGVVRAFSVELVLLAATVAALAAGVRLSGRLTPPDRASPSAV